MGKMPLPTTNFRVRTAESKCSDHLPGYEEVCSFLLSSDSLLMSRDYNVFTDSTCGSSDFKIPFPFHSVCQAPERQGWNWKEKKLS
jgi:hypothetical protein